MTRSVVRALAGVLGLLGVGVVAVPGCVIVVSDDGGEWYAPSFNEKETRTSTLEHVAGSAIDVKSANGSVTIEKADRKDVQVTATITAKSKERLAATKVLAERRDDKTLAIYVKWPDDKRRSNEGCSLEILVPDAGAVKVRSSNGAVSISGLSGKADLDTSNGSVKVVKHVGEVKINTSNGSVTVEDATGPVDADTSNSSVKVSLRPDAPGPVKIDTSNGSVTLAVGKAFAGLLKISTSNGSINLPSERAVKVVSKSRGSAKVEFREGGRESVIDTSNASVTVNVSE